MTLKNLNSTNSFLIFQVLKFGTLVLINIILAKSSIPLADLGIFESFNFYASAFSFFWIIGISQGLLSIYNQNSNVLGSKNTLLFSAFSILMALSFVFSIGLLIIYGSNVYTILSGLSKTDIVLLSIYLMVYPSGYLMEFVFLLNHKFKILVIFSVFSLALNILLVTLPAIFGFEIHFSIYGLIIWAIIKFIYLLYVLKIFTVFKFNIYEISKLLKTCLPLIASALLAGSATYIDGLIVSQKFNSETFAIYRYGAREFPLFLMISNAFSLSILPLFSNPSMLKSNLEEIKKKSTQYIRYLFPLGILFMITSQYIFQHIFNENFYESYYIFDIYILLIISRFLFPSTILMGLKKNNIILLTSIVELIINLTASLIFVNYFGYAGVAYGTLLAYISEKAILSIFVKWKLKIPLTTYCSIKVLTINSGILITIFIIKLIILI